jgi:uncharacterized protein YndB with AHSA1/START domain
MRLLPGCSTAGADPAAKAVWFAAPPDKWVPLVREHDFRVGGRERLHGRWPGGMVSSFDALYQDIVPAARIVYTYDMHLDDRRISVSPYLRISVSPYLRISVSPYLRISVSLATIEFSTQGAGTRLTVTEQGVFLDGYDKAADRETGTRALLDRLETSLRDAS